jgi:hypothetical protein
MAYVSFAHVKRETDIRKIIAHYKMEEGMVDRGEQIKTFCVFHEPSSEPTLSFTQQDDNTVFQCLSDDCDSSGNAIDLVQALEDLPSFRAAAIFCQDHFLKSDTGNSNGSTRKRPKLKNRTADSALSDPEHEWSGMSDFDKGLYTAFLLQHKSTIADLALEAHDPDAVVLLIAQSILSTVRLRQEANNRYPCNG